MNGERDRADVPRDVAALAELDAGLPTAAEAARLRAAATADPDAAAVLEALAATRAELAALATPEPPAAVTDRWTAALAAEARARPAPPAPPARPPRRPAHRHMDPCGRADAPVGRHMDPCGRGDRRARRWTPRRVLAAAAVVAVVAGAGLGLLRPAPAPPAPAVTRVELVTLGRAAVGTMDVGPFVDPQRRAACLQAVAPAAAHEVLLGGRQVLLDGRPGVLLVLATGTVGRLRIITVDPSCGPAGGTLLAQLVVG